MVFTTFAEDVDMTMTVKFRFRIQKEVPIYSISAAQVYEELKRLVRDTSYKAEKRRNRLRIVCECMGIPYHHIESVKEDNRIEMSETFRLKTEIKGALTNIMCDKTALYPLSAQLLACVRDKLCQDVYLSQHLRSKDIMIVMKGGIAQKNAMKMIKPDMSGIIDRSFGLDGDNDVTILINPDLHENDFNESMRRTLDLVVEALEEQRDSRAVKEINSIIESLIEGSEVTSHTRRDFTIENGRAHKRGLPHEFYISRCDEYNFNPHERFALVRFMRCYYLHRTSYKGKAASEVLDISVPLQDNAHLREEFAKFQSLEFAYATDY